MYHKRTKLFLWPKSNRTFMLKLLSIHDFLLLIYAHPDSHSRAVINVNDNV